MRFIFRRLSPKGPAPGEVGADDEGEGVGEGGCNGDGASDGPSEGACVGSRQTETRVRSGNDVLVYPLGLNHSELFL